MSGRIEDKIRLDHILEAISELREYTHGLTYEIFEESTLIHNASVRQLEIIGEACTKISEDVRALDSEIPWRQIIGLRNILIHNYFGIDLKVIWDVIQNDIPAFEVRIKNVSSFLV